MFTIIIKQKHIYGKGIKRYIVLRNADFFRLYSRPCNRQRNNSTEERTLNNFTKVSVAGSTDVTVVKGTAFKVQVKGYNNLLPYFETKVVNGNLIMGYKNHVNVRNDNTEVTVTLPVLNGVATSGSGDIVSTGDFVDNDNFEATTSGSGNITLEDGASKHFSSKISGSGDIKAFGFTSEQATINIAGSGNTSVTATDKLEVKISGSGNVYYKGSPAVSATVQGSGTVIKQ